MIRTQLLPGLLAGLAVLLYGCASAPPEAALPEALMDAAQTSSRPDEQLALEARIMPVVWVAGEAPEALPLSDHMAKIGVPAVSIAVYRGGELHWAEGYGEGADRDTLFQAASLSKMVAAVGITALAQEKGVSLDADISASLPGIDMATFNPQGAPITLRALLSHTNGATVSGFPGYEAGLPVPSTLEVITGSGGANTDAVVIRPNPDRTFAYSGGGYTVAQYWAEQASGENFAAMMQRLVLVPAGMTQSTFAQPLPDGFAGGNVAAAHSADGEEIAGRWHTYPELAAAGLWTTPSDYGRFLVTLGKASAGEAGTGIDPAVAAQVTAPVVEDYGLGAGIVMYDGEKSLQHSGGNEGYMCFAMALPERGDVIVTMTNSDNGHRLYRDILTTAQEIYGWPSDTPETLTRVMLGAEALAAYAGAYVQEGAADVVLELTAGDTDLLGTSPFVGSFRLVPVGEGVFVDPENGFKISSEDVDGDVRLSVMGMVLEKVAPE
jgi:CubicO group peptidase (beta-lactamase class C family)